MKIWAAITAVVATPIVFSMWVCWLQAKAQQDDLSPNREKNVSAP